MIKYSMYAALLLAGIALVPVLTQNISFTYVIDITGSMGNDIAGVKSTASSLLSDLSAFSHITEYNLVKFQDAPLPPTVTTTTALALLPSINALSYSGGGDCPENSMTAVLHALTISQPGSIIIGFTDASANDLHLLPAINSLISSTGSTLTFLLTGSCPSSDSPSAGVAFSDDSHANDLHKAFSDSEPVSAPSVGAPGNEVYYEIASASGGYVFAVNKDDVATVLETVKDLVLPSSSAAGLFKVHLKSLESPSAAWFGIGSFSVDATLSEVVISLTGANAHFSLTDNLGSALTFPPGVVLLDLPNAYIVKIPNPTPGTWSVRYSSTSDHKLLITGTSSIDFKYEIVDAGTGNAVGQPVAGSTVKVNIEIIGDGNFGTMNIRALADSSLIISPMTSTGPNSYSTRSFVVPIGKFHIDIVGSGPEGAVLKRMTRTPITPVIRNTTTTTEPVTKTTTTESPTTKTPTTETPTTKTPTTESPTTESPTTETTTTETPTTETTTTKTTTTETPTTKTPTTNTPTTKTTPPTSPRPPSKFDNTPCQNSTEFHGTCQMNNLPCPGGKYVDGLCRDPNNKGIKWIKREIYRSCCIVGSGVGY